MPSDSAIVEVLFARSNRQFVGPARLEGVRLVGSGDSPLRLLVILVDAAGSETGESTAGVIHQAGQRVASQEREAICEALLNLHLQALVVRRSGTFNVVEDLRILRKWPERLPDGCSTTKVMHKVRIRQRVTLCLCRTVVEP